MGLIVLLMMSAFLFVIALIVFTYIFIARKIITINISRPIRIITVISLLPVFAVPIYYLFSFYQNSSDMVYARGLFGLAPKTSNSIELDTGNGKLNFIIGLDFNTGARGGAFIKNSFFFLINNQRKEIVVTQHEINMSNNFYKKALKTERIADEDENHRGYGKYYYDLYFSPNIFSIEEYEQINDFLKHNHKMLSKKINGYKDNQKSRVFNKTQFRNSYYQDIASLNKTYECDNNLRLHLSATRRLFFITKDNISTSYNDIGNIKENKLFLDKYVKLSKESGKYQMYRGNTLVKDCFDKNGTNLLEEFKLEKI